MTTKWPKDLRKGDLLIWDGKPVKTPVEKVVPIFGGSWFDVYFKGIDEPVPFGHSEKIEVKG